MALKVLVQLLVILRVCFLEKRGNKHLDPSDKTVCSCYKLTSLALVNPASMFLSLSSGESEAFCRITIERFRRATLFSPCKDNKTYNT